MSDDPFDDPGWQEYAQHAIDKLLPMMEKSSVIVSLVPKGTSDVKFAVELGFSIMLDKPIIAMIAPGTKIPAKLIAVADHIVEWDPSGGHDELMARLKPIIDSIKDDDE